MPKSMPNSQVKAVAMAMAGATLAAVSTMFVPVAMLESVTGATGLSELIPAARAPLGDTARALIAFGAGAFTLSALTCILLRFDGAPAQRPVPAQGPVQEIETSVPDWMVDDEAEKPTFADRLARIRLPVFALPKMPWQHDEDAITELADLPKLRNGDTHPDAPPRRPLSATQDLPVLDLADVATEVSAEPAAAEFVAEETVAEVAVSEVALPEPVAPVDAEIPTVASAAAEDVQPTLAEMVAQLEAAVAERQKQLDELESVAAVLAVHQPVPAAEEDAHIEVVADADVSIEPTRDYRPTLEVVHDVAAVQDDNMDSALAAALATLKRMNGAMR
jgi:hypothetical protein